MAQRPRVAYDMWERKREQLIAEHGLSLLLTNAGLSREAAIHNMGVLQLQVRLPDLRAIVRCLRGTATTTAVWRARPGASVRGDAARYPP